MARVGRPHGVTGEVHLNECALEAAELLALGPLEWRGGGHTRMLTPRAARGVSGGLLARFAGVDTREAAAAIVNGELWVDAARLPDPGEGAAWTFEVVGLRVVTPEGRELGVVRDVIFNGPQALYVVAGERERLLPGFAPFVRRVDVAGGTVTLALPPGFEDL